MLDTFVFADPRRTLELNPTENDRLRQTLEDVALGRLDARATSAWTHRAIIASRNARLNRSVHFDPNACDTATLIEIIAEDRPGLLYDLSSAISIGRLQHRCRPHRHGRP